MSNRYRLYCITDFSRELSFWEQLVKDHNITYAICGDEVCPSTKNKHFQCFVYFTNPRSVSGTRKLFKGRHVEACKGDEKSNIRYCSKDENVVFEHGDRPKQGARKDLDTIRDEILDGKSVEDIAMEHPTLYHQYGRTLSKLEDIALRRKKREWMTKGIWYWGPTGVGKSHHAFENFDPSTHYVLPNDNGWWDGYTGQETVIINDFRGEIPYNHLLQMIDKWPFWVRRRCREPAPFLAKTVIITSSLPPEDIYNRREAEDHIEQLLRRMTVILLAQKCSEGNTGTSEPFSG